MPTEPDSPLALRVISYVLRAAAAVLILGAGIGIFVWLVATRPRPAHTPPGNTAISVRAIALRPMPVPRIWEGYGTARAMESADVSAQVSARVIERPAEIEPGARVDAGQVLVKLDPVDFQQRVEASLALIASWGAQVAGLDVEERRLSDQLELMQDELRLEERELERITQAVEQLGANALEIERRQALLARRKREMAVLQQQLEAIPPRREQLRAQVANERATLRLAQENLDRATVRAPISGVLQDVFVEPGELLMVGAPIARVVDVSRIEVPLRLPVSASARLRVGDGVEMGPDSPGDGGGASPWVGRVVRIAPEAHPGSRTITVFAEVAQEPDPSRGGLLLPGQFVLARVTTGAEEHPVVPRIAVDRDRLMVVENGAGGSGTRAREAGARVMYHIRRSFPELDPLETEWAVLESGPPPGTLVITSNLDEIRDGTPVRVERSATVATDGRESPVDQAGGGGGGGS